ncbi:DUF2062 domain-containing protein [Methylomonas sp. AM2-LC]|uniref:DUF2062 domain-containing protein n=1 Tax=Methylomonas sp. AM2-LC TaxID=3153301 RepID=UPI003267753D
MAKRAIRKIIPNQEYIKSHKILRILGPKLNQPNLWFLNRKSVSLAIAIGVFCAWIPTPAQMLISAGIAMWLGSNLPISILAVWVANPVTIAPMCYSAYMIGALFLNLDNSVSNIDFTLTWLISEIESIWQPFVLGSLIMGITSAFISYFLTMTLWRFYVIKKWRLKKSERWLNTPWKIPGTNQTGPQADFAKAPGGISKFHLIE